MLQQRTVAEMLGSSMSEMAADCSVHAEQRLVNLKEHTNGCLKVEGCTEIVILWFVFFGTDVSYWPF